jgi:2-keto-3-deoxy-galactonokinase
MKIEEMTPELIEKAKACKTTEELMKFFMENHISLPDEYLENVSGGVNADEYDSEYAKAGARECAVSGLGRAAFAGRILATLGGKDKAKLQSYLLGAVLALDVQAMQSFVGDQENVEAYIAGKAPLQQCFCDVMEALAAGEAHQVPAEISGKMGLEGVLDIAF